MLNIMDFPAIVFLSSFIIMSAFTLLSHFLFRRIDLLDTSIRETFNIIQSATLTLLALIVGFSFSMSINNYDARAQFEESEANTISTAYKRFDFLPEKEETAAKKLLTSYLDLRINFYQTHDPKKQDYINNKTVQKGNELWLLISDPVKRNQTAVMASVSTAVTDVLNSAVYAQAAWKNRIPLAAWSLMFILSTGCCILVGYGSQHNWAGIKLTMILPFVISFSFMLISDIDSTQSGAIFVDPLNLIDITASFKLR